MVSGADSQEPAALHVLVVEDHAQVRKFVAIVLGNAGFRVTTAADGDEARRVLEGGAVVDLLFSDIRMPGSMDGIELARWVRTHHPAMAILLQTGYSEVRVDEFPVLQKPYAPEALIEAIHGQVEATRATKR